MRRHFFNEDYFESIDNEHKAYWLGFIAADGAVTKASQYNSYRLQIILKSDDESHLMKFKNEIEAYDVDIKQTISKGFGYGNLLSRLDLNSFKMCSDLSKYYIHPNKTYDIQLADINKELMRHYLRGFFDGDAGYSITYDNKNKRYRYNFDVVGASGIIFEQIHEYLKSVGIKVNVYKRQPIKSNWSVLTRLVTSSKAEILKLIDFLYKDATVYLDRKFEKINEIKSIAA